jgi:hypothetical protein
VTLSGFGAAGCVVCCPEAEELPDVFEFSDDIPTNISAKILNILADNSYPPTHYQQNKHIMKLLEKNGS